MAIKPDVMADTLIAFYRNDEEKDKGKYRLSKDDFKSIAGKAVLKEAYFWAVDAALREDGFMLLCIRNDSDQIDQIGVFSISTVIKTFQELPKQLVKENICPNEDNDE